jgi:alpha-tubulin suppressor-like RCC1 family protein
MFTPSLQDVVRGAKNYPPLFEENSAAALSYLKDLMMAVGLTEEGWDSVTKALSAVIHLQCLVVSGTDNVQITTATKVHVGYAERLLGMEPGLLTPFFYCKSTDGTMASKADLLSANQVKTLIDGISVEIYQRSMNYLLNICTKHIAAAKPESGRAGPSILLVDSFGYELSSEASAVPLGLMHFCANVMEERIHDQFISRVFKKESEFLLSEGLDPINVPLPDIDSILAVIDRPPSGMMNLIEEASLFARGNDISLVDKLFSAHSKSRLVKSAGRSAKQTCFIMKHSFGELVYDVDGFIAVNKSKAPTEVMQLLDALPLDCFVDSQSASAPVPPTSEEKIGSSGRGSDKTAAKAALIASRYRDATSGIIHKFEDNDNTLFVLCIKPNSDMRGFTIDPDLVAPQLRYFAVVEQAKVAKESFPYRRTYREFYERYRPMLGFNAPGLPLKLSINDDHKALCKALIRSCTIVSGIADLVAGESAPKYGQTYIFLRNDVVETLESTRFQIMRRFGQAAIMLQAAARCYVDSSKFKKARDGITRLQAVVRAKIYRKLFLFKRGCAVKIQGMYLTRHERGKFLRLKAAVDTIKSNLMGKMILHLRYKRLKRSLHMIHDLARGFIIRQQANHVMLAIFLMQRAARAFLVRNRAYYRRKGAVVTLQRIFRGWETRLHYAPEVNTLKVLRDQRKAIRVAKIIQANWRRIRIERRFEVVSNATLIIQRWSRSRLARMRFVKIRSLNTWLQCVARRILANNRVNRLRLIVMMKQEVDRMREVREMELAHLKKDFDLKDPTSAPQIGAGLHDTYGKFVRFLIGFDAILDTSEAYPNGWTRSIIELDKTLQKTGKRRLHKIAVGGTHTVLVDSFSNVYTFGMGDEGQLGHGNRVDELYPRLVETLVYQASVAEGALSRGVSMKVEVTAVCAGKDHTLLLTGSGRVYTWGSNHRGQLGHSNFQSSALPRMLGGPIKNVKIIACGAYHSACLVDPGVLYTWGARETLGCSNTVFLSATKQYLKVGAPVDLEDASEPKGLPFFAKRRIQYVACGDSHTIVFSNGDLYSWGMNNYGQLGIGNTLNKNEPSLIEIPNVKVVKVDKNRLSVGGRHAVLLVNGRVYAWGWNKWGQVDGGLTISDALSPVEINLSEAFSSVGKAFVGDEVIQVSSGWRHSMALTSLGEIISWGRAGLLFDRRDVESDQMMPLKPYMTMEDELRVASSINPAPVLVSLPQYAATDRAVNIFESHSSMVSFTAVEILFQDTISNDLIKKSRYVSNRKVTPWSRSKGAKSTVEDEFLKIKKSSMASWNQSVQNSLATDRLSNASTSPDKTASNSHSPARDSYLERRRREDEERRRAEGHLTEDGLLAIFSPLQSKRRVDVSSDADFREASMWQQPASQTPAVSGTKMRSSSLYAARPASGLQPGVLESFAARRREIPVSPMNAAPSKPSRVSHVRDDSQNAWLAESADSSALSLSAVRNLAAMIQNIKKESVQQSKHQHH